MWTGISEVSDAQQRQRFLEAWTHVQLRVCHRDSSLEFGRACRPPDEMLVLLKVILVFSSSLVGMGVPTLHKRETPHNRREEEKHHCVWMLGIDRSRDVDDRGYACVGWASIRTVVYVSREQSLCGVKGDLRYVSGGAAGLGRIFSLKPYTMQCLPRKLSDVSDNG